MHISLVSRDSLWLIYSCIYYSARLSNSPLVTHTSKWQIPHTDSLFWCRDKGLSQCILSTVGWAPFPSSVTAFFWIQLIRRCSNTSSYVQSSFVGLRVGQKVNPSSVIWKKTYLSLFESALGSVILLFILLSCGYVRRGWLFGLGSFPRGQDPGVSSVLLSNFFSHLLSKFTLEFHQSYAFYSCFWGRELSTWGRWRNLF